MTILAIDPGPTESGYVLFDERADYDGLDPIIEVGVAPNDFVLGMVYGVRMRLFEGQRARLAIEWVQSYGMPVGIEVFDTVLWVGRFVEANQPDEAQLITRHAIKVHLCGSARAKDPNVRQALLDRYGGRADGIGSKASPGPLYGVKSHAWAALAVAITLAERDREAVAAAVDRSVAHVLG